MFCLLTTHTSRMLLVILLTCKTVSAASKGAVQQVIKLQRRLTGSSIMSYSLDMTCVAQQSTFMLRHSDAVRRPSGKNCTLTVSTTGRQQSAVSQQLSLNKTAPSQNTKVLSTQGLMQGLSRPIPHCERWILTEIEINQRRQSQSRFSELRVTTSWVPEFGAVVHCICIAITRICIALAYTSALHLHITCIHICIAFAYALHLHMHCAGGCMHLHRHLHMHTLHLHRRAKPQRGERPQVCHVCSFRRFVHKQPCVIPLYRLMMGTSVGR